MAKKNVHVTKHSDGWQVIRAGNEKATKVVETQKEAIQIAREIAINQQSELIIHGTNGRIREKNSYGSDSNPPKG